MNQREAFEKWCLYEGVKLYDEDAELCWNAWQAAQQPQWLPIETAPRDGSVVILYNDGEIAAGWWHPHRHINNNFAYDWCFIEDTKLDEDQKVSPNAWLKKHPPSHWMPLPPEPKP